MGDLIDIWDRILMRRLREDAEALELPKEVSDRIWQRMIAENPEFEDLVLDLAPELEPRGFVRRWLTRLWHR